jgi:hypothetical protein
MARATRSHSTRNHTASENPSNSRGVCVDAFIPGGMSFETSEHSIGSINAAFVFGKEFSGLALRRMVTVFFIGLAA